jgi:alginate O-acetyltransferase complex protein AlgI
MTFNSLEYVWFFLIVLTVFWSLVRRDLTRTALMLVASWYFYASHNHSLIWLILASTQIDYVAGRLLERNANDRHRKLILAVSMTANLGMLFYFKYFNFLGASVEQMFALVGWKLSWVDRNIILPVGISFYTFQTMSYTIDVYRREIPAERSWLKFSFFVAYFPQLVAGPIVRASEFLHQLRHKPSLDAPSMDRALALIALGFVKKVVCGDYLGGFVEPFFADPLSHGTLKAWLGIYAFAFQIYFDFSGYSDIATGCAKLMGYDLPRNFRSPYIAVGFTDFWRRWHISLSTWLRDYLYRPLGGNRKGSWMTYRNLMLTMLLGGLWHGAAWHFVIWGFLHGTALVVERFANHHRKAHVAPGGAADLLIRIAFFHAVCLTWVAFRADGLGDMMNVFTSLLRWVPDSGWTWGSVLAIGFVVAGWAAQYWDERHNLMDAFLRRPLWVRSAVYAVCIGVIAIFGSATSKPFIYFQF